jgi:hypothetical protein
MELPAHVPALLDRRIEAYLNGPPHELKEAARPHRALPVYVDADGALFLTSDGAVLFKKGNAADAVLTPETSTEWQIVARLAAAERFPELKDLIPARPASAVTCPECDGCGRVLNNMIRCGVCYGLGWEQPRT